MSKCPHIGLRTHVWCVAGEHPQRRRGVSAPHDMQMQHVDMITPQAAPCVLGWSLTTYLKTLSIGAKTTRSDIAPSEQPHPTPPPPSLPATAIYLPFSSLINMEMSHSLLLVKKKAVTSLVTDSMDVFGLQGLLFFREHVLSLFRQRIKNVNMASLASVSKLNSMIFNAWQNPLNRRAAFVILSLLLSPLCVAVNFSKGKLLNLQRWMAEALQICYFFLSPL